MNQDSLTPGRLTSRAPVFFWITVGLLALLFVGGIAVALLLALEAKEINRQGGWGWLLVGGIYVAAATVICSACGICAAVSLFRREAYRPLSMAILIISSLVVWAFGPNLIRVVNRLRRQHQELARTDKHSAQPPSGSTPRATIPSTVDKSANAPAVRELKSKLWEAIRTKNADAFVDCYCIEARFNTPEVREANRSQAEILLRSETIDVEIRDIPEKELVEIMKIQKANPDSLVRYSLVPRLMLWVRQKAVNGTVGRGFLIGEQNGRWHIITLAGHTT